MPTLGPTPTATDLTFAPTCPACRSGKHRHVEDFGIEDQFREYAAGDSLELAELIRRSGLEFAVYSRLECRDCGLRYSQPMRAPSGGWYSYTYDKLDIHAADRWEFAFVLDRLRPDDRLGEVGCGTGVFLGGAHRCGIHAQGLDFSAGSIAECVRKGLDAREVNVDLDDLSVAADRTVIASFHVLEHLGEPAQLFRLASRWAAPGATLWLAVPSDRNMTRLVGKRDILDEPPHHLTQWTPEALRTLGRATGWTLDHVLHEQMGYRQRLWTLCTNAPLYRALVRRPTLREGWGNRLLRYGLYPSIAARHWGTLRKLSGLSMLGRFSRAD